MGCHRSSAERKLIATNSYIKRKYRPQQELHIGNSRWLNLLILVHDFSRPHFFLYRVEVAAIFICLSPPKMRIADNSQGWCGPSHKPRTLE